MQRCLSGLLISLVFYVMSFNASAKDAVLTAHNSNGSDISYLITFQGEEYEGLHPRFVTLAMPGGNGVLEPRIAFGQIDMQAKNNFLIRSRSLFADTDFVAASTDASSNPERVQAIVDDLHQRFGAQTQIYLVGTSRGTLATMALSEPLDGKVAGFVHTSSMSSIARFDTRSFKSRHLIVHHLQDGCRVTQLSAAQNNHEKFSTPLILMDGGNSVGDPCQAMAFHGYHEIEKETVDKIKDWIRQAP